MSSPFTAWPNGRRIAIAITPMSEVWPDGKGPANLVQRTQVKPGVVDHQAITWPHYADREGVWRIIRILDQRGVPGTFCTNARCAEVYPDAVSQIVRSGHDIARLRRGHSIVSLTKSPTREDSLTRKSRR